MKHSSIVLVQYQSGNIYLCSAANLFAAAIMKCWPSSMELVVQEAMANHLKYATNRAGSGGRKK
jgi:hypothetical protein